MYLKFSQVFGAMSLKSSILMRPHACPPIWMSKKTTGFPRFIASSTSWSTIIATGRQRHKTETQDCISSWHSSQISCQGLETSKTGSGTNVKHREVSIANPFCRGRNVAKQTGRQRRAQTDRFADMVLLSGSLCAIKETLSGLHGTLTFAIGCVWQLNC